MFDILSKKSKDECALSGLQSRLLTLQKQLDAAQADEKAAEDVQRTVYRNSQDRTACDNADATLIRLQTRIKGLTTAIVEAKSEIAEIEQRIAAEKSRVEHEQAANKISFVTETFAITVSDLERSISNALAAMKPVIEKLPGFVPGVDASRIQPNITAMLNAQVAGMKEVIELGRTHAETVRSSVTAISAPTPPPELPKAEPPAPVVERRTLYIFGQDVKWTEPDGTVKTAPAYSVVDVPGTIAVKAIKNNLADDAGSLRSVTLREVHGRTHGPARPAAECIDLEHGKADIGPKIIDEKSRNPNLHSMSDMYSYDKAASGGDWVGKGERVGTAQSVPARSVPRY